MFSLEGVKKRCLRQRSEGCLLSLACLVGVKKWRLRINFGRGGWGGAFFHWAVFQFKGVGLKEQKLAKFGNVSFLACKIRSFQNDNAIFVNRQELTFFGVQKGLWGGRRGSIFLIFRKKGVKYLKKINLSRVGDR